MVRRPWWGSLRWSDLYAPVGLGAFLFMVAHDQTERPWLMAGCLALMGLSPVIRADDKRRRSEPEPTPGSPDD